MAARDPRQLQLPMSAPPANGRARATIMTAERYVTAPELAQLMGVSVRTIKRMTAAGMPSETWGMSRTRRYLPSQAMDWASARGTMTAANHRPRRLTSATGQRREE